ncbi:MAG: tRNA-binding protein [Candidatus Aenigmarchaeota archaeon]|nr:tRNA-binding protein [Candidatus Aenigmarchaeota archaeon]
MATFEEFQKIDIRIGKIVDVELLQGAKYTTHKLTIDFGKEMGMKVSCARLINYSINQLIGRIVLAIVNLPPRQIGKHTSEVLTLGVPDKDGECILIQPDKDVQLGSRLY